ncbi:MAG: hypothetical protein RSA70_07095 [Clostridia bacterium]
MIKFIIPLAPRTKKNSMKPRISRDGRFLGLQQSDAYRVYEETCLWLIPGAARQGVSYPVNVRALYYMPTRGIVDIANLHSALHDVLVKSGVLSDDNSRIVVSTDGSRVFYDKANPRTEVGITGADT